MTSNDFVTELFENHSLVTDSVQFPKVSVYYAPEEMRSFLARRNEMNASQPTPNRNKSLWRKRQSEKSIFLSKLACAEWEANQRQSNDSHPCFRIWIPIRIFRWMCITLLRNIFLYPGILVLVTGLEGRTRLRLPTKAGLVRYSSDSPQIWGKAGILIRSPQLIRLEGLDLQPTLHSRQYRQEEKEKPV